MRSAASGGVSKARTSKDRPGLNTATSRYRRAALVTVTINPALGLTFDWVAELIRAAIVRRMIPERPKP
jgi:hypothetical protein